MNNKPIISGKLSNSTTFAFFSNDAHHNSWLNLSKIFNKEYLLKPTHCCTPLTKTLMQTVENKYFSEWDNTRKNRFRSNHDIPPIGMCINYNIPYNSIYSKNVNYYFYVSNIYLLDYFYKNKKLICVNNLTTESEYKKLKSIFFNKILK